MKKVIGEELPLLYPDKVTIFFTVQKKYGETITLRQKPFQTPIEKVTKLKRKLFNHELTNPQLWGLDGTEWTLDLISVRCCNLYTAFLRLHWFYHLLLDN